MGRSNSRKATTKGAGGRDLVKGLILAAASVTAMLVVLVDGHGHLFDPPMRSTVWRWGFNTPINYDDNWLACGGTGVIIHSSYSSLKS